MTSAILESTLAALAAYQGLQQLRSLRASGEGVIDGRRIPDVRGSASRSSESRANRATKPGRFGASKTDKAGSAESILAYCLKRRGWTSKWKAGELTGRQHLQLLEDVRQYGRRWLRHEAEGVFRHYGTNAQATIARGASHLLAGCQVGGVLGSPESTQKDSRGQSIFGDGESHARSITGSVASAVSRFFRRARSFVHELVLAGGMILKGNEPLTADEVDSLDRSAKVQMEFLDRFEREVLTNPPKELPQDAFATVTQVVEGPPMTAGQFVARAESYGNSAWQSSIRANHQSVISTGVMKLERRVLGHPRGEHCEDCPPLAAMGWQPLGTLPAIGDSECKWLCLCHFEYQDANAKPHITNTKPTRLRQRKTVVVPSAKWSQPTKEEIDAEVKKWIEGKPNKLTLKKPGEPPIVPGVVNPREGGGWKNEAGQAAPTFTLPPQSSPISPQGYTYEEAD